VDLFDVARSCARRWYVLLPLLLIVGWFSHSAYSSVKPVYWANAVIGLAPQSARVDAAAPGVPVPRNGLLDVGGASLVANMTAIALKQPAVVDQVVQAGGLRNYGAQMFPVPATTPQLPLVWVEATNADPAAVTKTLEILVQQTAVTLHSLQQQARVPDDQMVEPFVVQPPSVPAKGMPSRTRSTIAILVAGAGLAILASVLLDAFLTRRRAKRRASLASVQVGAESEPVDASTDGQRSTTATEGALEAR
jgi:hypothetical protein